MTSGSGIPRNKRTVMLLAREAGIAGEVECLQLALAAMIGGYDRLVATTPECGRGVITGAFGNSAEVAKAILMRSEEDR